MKVESTGAPSGVVYSRRTSASSLRKTSESSEDKVELSDLIGQLHADESSFDAARVLEIKQAISEGRFTINADAIASRLIESAKELLIHRQR
jgi:negative regulator of flagellin synthesis FlgM